MESIVDEELELSYRPAGLWEYLEAIKTEMSSELYIIIHNLDGPMLRSDKSQDILSRVASMQNVHLIASIDHINASLSEYIIILRQFYQLIIITNLLQS